MCFGRRACSRHSSRRPCARRACWPSVTTRTVIGAPFYVMEQVEGAVVTNEIPAPLDTPEPSAAAWPRS